MNGNIFSSRENILPYEYPQLLKYKDAIRHSYWINHDAAPHKKDSVRSKHYYHCQHVPSEL